jgi:hypothetical protein
MLREVANVHQQAPHLRRRWFCDDYFDLFLWEKAACDRRIVVGFQLCYDKSRHERVLNWRESTGYTHHAIDSGDRFPGTPMTPIMVADGVLPLPAVLVKFDASAAGLESRLRDFIRERLLDYGAYLDKAKAGG